MSLDIHLYAEENKHGVDTWNCGHLSRRLLSRWAISLSLPSPPCSEKLLPGAPSQASPTSSYFSVQFFFAPQVLLVPSSKQKHPHTLTPRSPKVTAERTIKDWGLVHFLPETAVPTGGDLLLILSTWSREKENRRKRESYVLTDLGSSLLRASCFLFFPPDLLLES